MSNILILTRDSVWFNSSHAAVLKQHPQVSVHLLPADAEVIYQDEIQILGDWQGGLPVTDGKLKISRNDAGYKGIEKRDIPE